MKCIVMAPGFKNELVADVFSIAKNSDERITIANNGMQKVRTLHTDTQRTKSLLEIVKGIRG